MSHMERSAGGQPSGAVVVGFLCHDDVKLGNLHLQIAKLFQPQHVVVCEEAQRRLHG